MTLANGTMMVPLTPPLLSSFLAGRRVSSSPCCFFLVGNAAFKQQGRDCGQAEGTWPKLVPVWLCSR